LRVERPGRRAGEASFVGGCVLGHEPHKTWARTERRTRSKKRKRKKIKRVEEEEEDERTRKEEEDWNGSTHHRGNSLVPGVDTCAVT
jgi:hypothetical protein